MAASNEKDIFFLGSCAVYVPSSILEHLVLAKGTFVFLSDVETYQSASKALFVAPRYSDFFLCFIHIFLSKLGVPYRLPPVSGREASAPGVMFRSYSAIFLKRCLRLANKAQEGWHKAFISVACAHLYNDQPLKPNGWSLSPWHCHNEFKCHPGPFLS